MPCEGKQDLARAAASEVKSQGAPDAGDLLQELRRENDRLRQAQVDLELTETFFNRSLNMLCIFDEHARFRKVNATFCKVLGYAADELLGRPFVDFVDPSDRTRTLKEIEKQFADGMTVDIENQYRCKDGATRLLSWHAIPDKMRRVVYASARDITMQRASEEQLNKLWLAVEQTSHSIVITDLAGRIEYVNRAFSEISGYAAAEVLGRNPRVLNSGQTPAATYADMWKTLGRGDLWQGEFYNRRKNGQIYRELARISPVRQSDGRITHYLAIKEDITEHSRAVEAIRESKILLQRVIDSTPDWIHVTDRDGRFMLVNHSFASAFNQTPDSMLGRDREEVLPARLWKTHAGNGMRDTQRDDAAVLNGEAIHDPCDKIYLEGGKLRIFDMFKGPLRDSSHRIYGVLCFRRDVTERFNTEQEQKALEMQLRQAQKMELIGHLTGGIAHDFNNILAAMLGYAELIQMTEGIDRTPQVSQYLQEILQAGIRAKELVAQLLTFSRRTETANEAISVTPIVTEVAKLLRSTTPTSIQISTDIAKGLPPVLISPVRLHQVLMNLGVNACDAITGAGSIEIKVAAQILERAKVCHACHRDFSGKHLVMSVRDTGAGIPRGHLLKIFDPFFTTKEMGRGSGLGLSVLHGIVHSANGHIEVLSEPNKGTEFRIYLPAQEREIGRLDDDIVTEPGKVRVCGHVMVVDDEASIVGFITVLLESLGCKVTGLTSSSVALRMFQADPYCVDMVITDQTMPELTGAELAQAILALRSDIPIVMSTGYSNMIDEETARRIGIRRFLTKPVPAKVLADIVAEFLGAGTPGK